MRLALLAIVAIGVAGCNHVVPEPQVRIVETKVPTPVPCVSDATRPAPTYATAWEGLKAMTPGERYAQAVAGFKERDQRLAEIEPIIASCRK